MDNPIDKDIVKNVDALDMVGGSLAKPMIEKVVTPFAGNGTIMSGGLKLALAIGAAKYAGKGRIGKSLAIGAGMDAAEDIIVGIGMKGGIEPANQNDAGVF